MNSEQNHQYYELRCKEMDERLREMQARYRGALGDVRRAKVTTALIRKLYRLDYLKLDADALAARFIDVASDMVGVPRAAIFRRAEQGDGFTCIEAHGFIAPDHTVFAANGDRHGFVYSGDFDTDLTFIHDVRALTGARHFVWCYNRVSRLA
ncbi:MAG: hypothetical protein AB8G17_19125, partial [Gammaproteobacteria bacterium]